jgi:hypothetical protein
MCHQENGITRAMSLLSPEELEYYATPLAEQYAASFNAYEVSIALTRPRS